VFNGITQNPARAKDYPVTPPRTDAEIATISDLDAATQCSWQRWWAFRDACKAHGRSAWVWIKIGLKHGAIAVYLGILLNIVLTFAGF
jgi:CelD/BcsL family acetyltransferase involved in cellulose biosynthesis